MRILIVAVLLIPLCMLSTMFIVAAPAGEDVTTVQTGIIISEDIEQPTEPIEAIMAEVTEPATEPPTQPTMESVTQPPTGIPTEPQTETTEPPAKTEVTKTKVEKKEPAKVEDKPSSKKHEVQNDGIRSLGKFKLTAYCSCKKCCGKYAANRPVDENGNEIVYGSTGAQLQAGVSIAVDPRVIPYGTKVVINGHTYVAQDTGGSIKGKKIDVYFDDHQEALDFGVKKAEVFIYAEED